MPVAAAASCSVGAAGAGWAGAAAGGAAGVITGVAANVAMLLFLFSVFAALSDAACKVPIYLSSFVSFCGCPTVSLETHTISQFLRLGSVTRLTSIGAFSVVPSFHSLCTCCKDSPP